MVKKDGRIDAKDIKRLFPENRGVIEKTESLFGKKEKDAGWEDTTTWVLRRWGWFRRRYYWEPIVIPGYKHQDYNQDKKIDTEDIRLLIPDSKVRDAYLKTSKDVGWEDRLGKTSIPGTGYKNFDFDLNNRIDQLDLQILFSNKYEDGTLIKRDDKVYVMIGGGKMLIPDEKTFSILGFDHKDEITISNEEFSLIPDLGSLAPIKYDNGSIVKGVDNKLYLMSYGSKIEIPDKTTYEALGLNIADHTITIRAKGKADDNVYPIIQLRIDGQPVKEWFVSSEYILKQNWFSNINIKPLLLSLR